MVFEGTTGIYERIHRFNSKWIKSRTIERYWKYTSHPIKMRVFTYLSDSIAKWILCIYMLLIKSILSSTFIFVCSRHNQEIIMGTVQLCWPNIYSSSSPQKQNRISKKMKKNLRASSSGFSASENSTMERFHTGSWRPYWCLQTMKRRPCWCSKPILCESNSFRA